MAASPYYKAHSPLPGRGYVASFKYAEDAAQFCAGQGEGSKVFNRYGKLLWHEGHEEFMAYESFDRVAEVMAIRDGGTLNPMTN